MSASIARYLKDFSVPEPVVSAATSNFGTEFGDELSLLNFLSAPPAPAPDIDAELAESFEEGHAAATAELQEIHEAELAALRELALQWMHRVAEFRPHLSGAVWRGTATRLSDI